MMENGILTMEEYEKMFAENPQTMRHLVKAFKGKVETLKEIHRNARMTHNNPQDVIDEYVDAVGYEKAKDVISNIVNARAEWDGRISTRNKEWASNLANIDRDVIIRMGCYADDAIHSAHLDQLCDYMRRKEV